jgi:acyl-CoA synthetase (AMP-forming)/AMP-acid ligase II
MSSGSQTLVHNFLETSAKLWPAKIAFVHDDIRATYEQINSMANRLALWLLEQGIAEGDRVVIFLENTIEYVVSYYGALKTGGVAVPLSCDVKSDSLSAFLEDVQPRVIITSGKFEKLFQDINPDTFNIHKMLMKSPSLPLQSFKCAVVAWEDVVSDGTVFNPGLPIGESTLASIIYTSGSTGRPKGVMLSHKNIVSNTLSIVKYLNLSENDIQMVVLPFFYVMGKSLLNTHFAVGGTVVVNNRFAFPACVIEQMVSERVTGFSGVPSTYAYLLHRSPLVAYRDKLDSLRYCSQAGGHMSSMIKEKLLRALPSHTQLYIMYGATEAAARLTYVEPERLSSKIDSIGIPIPGVTVNVLDEKGNEVPSGLQGELVASGPNIMQGYWKDAESSSRVLDENGYHTGDMGYRDEEGYLYVTGRKDNLLKVGGHRINPQEIEDAMMATELLLEVAVVGVEDRLLGKRLVAIAVPINGETNERDILANCLTMLPRYKIPSEIKFISALPKNSSGKINRTQCLELFNKEIGHETGISGCQWVNANR